MRTPAGRECRYFYGDYFRGRSREECRLLAAQQPPLPWEPKLCVTCPLPAILMANACEHLDFHARLVRPFLSLRKHVVVDAYCRKTRRDVPEPHIGCGECHLLPPIFAGEPLEPDTAD